MTPPKASSSDPDEVRRSKDSQKKQIAQEALDLAAVLNTPEGRRFIKTLLVDCHEHRSVFNTNALVMAHMEGARNVGLKLKARIVRAAPENLAGLLLGD